MIISVMFQAIKREIFPMLMKDEVEEREMGNNYRQERRWDTLNTKKTHKRKCMQKVKCTIKLK